MSRIILDTTSCSTIDQLHECLRRELGFPEHYGRNLDALWDCVTSWVELPVTIEWHGFAMARSAIGEYVDRVLATLQEAGREIGDVNVEVKD